MGRTVTIADAAALLRSRADLCELGMHDRAIARAVAHGDLHRVRPGWYVWHSEWEHLWPEGRHLVHVLAVARDARGAPAVNAGPSAAVIHGLPLYRLAPKRVELLIATPRHIHSSPDVLRREGVLPSSDVTRVDGIPVTTLERTVVDMARSVTLEAAVCVADAALRKVAVRRNVQNEDLAAAWRDRMNGQLVQARGQRGIRQARWVVAFADGRAHLPGESTSRVQLHRIGFRDLDLQVPVPASGSGTYWLDFGLNDVDAFGEFDGVEKYTNAALRSNRTIEQVMLDEKRREDWIRGTTGRRVLRWGDADAATAAALATRLRAFGVTLPR